MTAALPPRANLKPNPAWASLPLFDRTGWRRVAFGEFAESIGERAEPKNAQEEIYVGLEHLDPLCLRIRRWGKGSDVTGTKLRFRKGDIVFGRRRAYQRKLAVAEFDGICSAHAMVVRAKPDTVLPEFLPFLMMSDRFMSRAVEISVGSLSPTINWTTLKHEAFDLPPLDQQRRIAEILRAVDEAISKKEHLAADLKNVGRLSTRAALMEGKCHDGRKLDSSRWRDVKLGDICELRNGKGFSAADWAQDGLPIIRIQNLNGSREFNYFAGEPDDNWIVEPGTLLFAWAGVRGVSFGPCVWSGPRGVLNQHIFRISPRAGINRQWLFETLKLITVEIEKKAHGFKIELVHVRKGDITEQLVRVPPEHEQAFLANYADSFSDAESVAAKDRKELKSVLTTLLNAAFL